MSPPNRHHDDSNSNKIESSDDISVAQSATKTKFNQLHHYDDHPVKLQSSPRAQSNNEYSHSHNIGHQFKGSRNQTNLPRKKRKFEETIIDGFAITAFKTWEDLQDELNEKISLNINNANLNNNNIGHTPEKKADKNDNSSSKGSSKQKHPSSTSTSNSLNSNPNNSLLRTDLSNANANKKKEKYKSNKKVSSGNLKELNAVKQQHGNTQSSDETTLREALEAKELAEKRLYILQEKLKEQDSSMQYNDNHCNRNNNTSDRFDQYSSTTPSQQISQDEIHLREQTGLLGRDLLQDPNATLQSGTLSYSPDHVNSHFHKSFSGIINQQNLQQPQSESRDSLAQPPRHLFPPQPTLPITGQPQNPQAPRSLNPQQTYRPPPTPQMHAPYLNQSYPFSSAHLHPLNQHVSNVHQQAYQSATQSHVPPPHACQPQQQSSSTISSMSMSAITPNYSYPPYIITDTTISRQTSIIPPLPTALDQAAVRYGHHPNILTHSMNFNPIQTPHPSLYYPHSPTERSFMEFARSYTGSSHLSSYPSLMNSLPTHSSNITTNPYGLDRWPRMAIDHQRAVSRYNSLFPGASTLPDRTNFSPYSTGARPPTFPVGLFVSSATVGL